MKEKRINEIIHSIFNKYPTSLSLYPKGLTNENWIFTLDNETYIFRYPTILVNNYVQEQKVIELLKNEELDVETIYFDPNTGIKITKYIDNLEEFSECTLPNKIEQTALLMKQLHDLQIQTHYHFHPIDKLEFYKSKVKHCPYTFEVNALLVKIKELDSNSILCHNDWVSGNILFGEKNYLIDYEYAADNDPLFDVMSFITENNIDDPKQRNTFYQTYFGKLPTADMMNKLHLWEQFHNCLWCYWALMMYEEKREDIYLEISEMKYEAYKKAKN